MSTKQVIEVGSLWTHNSGQVSTVTWVSDDGKSVWFSANLHGTPIDMPYLWSRSAFLKEHTRLL